MTTLTTGHCSYVLWNLCCKSSTIILVRKTLSITRLNDYRPLVSTSVIVKSFERICKYTWPINMNLILILKFTQKEYLPSIEYIYTVTVNGYAFQPKKIFLHQNVIVLDLYELFKCIDMEFEFLLFRLYQ